MIGGACERCLGAIRPRNANRPGHKPKPQAQVLSSLHGQQTP